MALQTFTDRAQRKIEGGAAEIRNDKERLLVRVKPDVQKQVGQELAAETSRDRIG
jgi:hypothetical protein